MIFIRRSFIKDGKWRAELYSQLTIGDKVFMPVDYGDNKEQTVELTIIRIKIEQNGLTYISMGDIYSEFGDMYHHYKEFTANDIGNSIFLLRENVIFH